MKSVFVGPTHRVQLSIHNDPTDRETKLFRVDALPRSAHRSCAYIRGLCVYVGRSPTEAWDAVLRLVPTAQVPAVLKPDLANATGAVPLCPYCGTAVRPHHRQTPVRWPAHRSDGTLVPAHTACVADDFSLDPKLLSR